MKNPKRALAAIGTAGAAVILCGVSTSTAQAASTPPAHASRTVHGDSVGWPTVGATLGKGGPFILEDWELLDELGHFARERFPGPMLP